MSQAPEKSTMAQTAPTEAEMAHAAGLLAMSNAEWKTYQDSRYPGTGEIVDTRRELLAEVEAFAAPDAPAATVFNVLDPTIAAETNPAARLAHYERIAIERLDFRVGPNGEIRERQEIAEILQQPREVVGARLWDATFEACTGLGMVESSELQPGQRLKAIGVLGASPAAIENRTRYAAEQLTIADATAASFDYVISVGEEESALKAMAAHLGVDIEQELSRVEMAKGTVTTFEPVLINGVEIPVRMIAAKPDPASGRPRATTLVSMDFWREVADIQRGDELVAVTTGLYTFFQDANAREVITWSNGASIQLIGHSSGWAGADRFANQLLQELKAGVDSKYRLYKRLAALAMAPPLPE